MINLLVLLVVLVLSICFIMKKRRKSTGKLYWHIHHDQLIEMATEPIARRRMYIRAYKPLCERETRLRCLQPVKGRLPDEVVEAFRLYDGTLQNHARVWKFRNLVSTPYAASLNLQMVLQKYEKEINRLHDKECDCNWDGTTLFPGGQDAISS